MTNLSPNYIAVDPDGTFTPVPATYDGIKAGLHGATFDVVGLADGEHCLFVDDEGMLNGARLNVPASIFAGMALYGPVVLCGSPDDEGDTQCPTLHAANGFMAMSRMWQQAERDAIDKGQTVELFANTDTLPPPAITVLTDAEFEGWLNGDADTINAVHQRARDERGQ